MIDDIVEMILKEASYRKQPSRRSRIYNVLNEVGARALEVMDNIEQEERRKKEDENKG